MGDENSSGLRDEFDRETKQFQARFRSKLFILAQLELIDWKEPLFKVLTDQDGISEIRFTANNVQQRPLGFVSNSYEYTFLLWAKEKGNHFIPRSACETVKKRKVACIADRSLACDIWFALE